MADLEAELTWAMPVDPIELITHFEAYLSLLPTLQALRLCNRFGSGPQAHITTLPTELVDRIESQLTAPARTVATKKWASLYKCFSGDCDTLDHYDEDELLNLYLEFRSIDESREHAWMSVKRGQTELTARQRRYVMEILDEDYNEAEADTHFQRCNEWKDNHSKRGFFEGHMVDFERLFGLHWRATHIASRTQVREVYGECDMRTLTHIATSAPPARQNAIEHNSSDYPCHKGNMIAQPVTMPEPLSEVTLKKFKRMMRVLDLHPKSNIEEVAPSDTDNSEKGETVSSHPSANCDTEESWPQLMLLAVAYENPPYW